MAIIPFKDTESNRDKPNMIRLSYDFSDKSAKIETRQGVDASYRVGERSDIGLVIIRQMRDRVSV